MKIKVYTKFKEIATLFFLNRYFKKNIEELILIINIFFNHNFNSILTLYFE